MATSGVSTFNVTRSDIINRAFRLIGVKVKGSEISGEDSTIADMSLNSLVKTLSNQHKSLWTREWFTATLSAPSEVVGTDGNNYYCIKGHTSSSATKPVTGAEYTTYWKKGKSSGGVWADATAYTSTNEVTLDAKYNGIEKAFVREIDSDTPIDIISFQSYLDLHQKFTEGLPTKITVDERYPTIKCYLYPYPDDYTNVIHLYGNRKIEDFLANADNPDFPIRWGNTLVYGLAYDLSDEYGLPLQERAWLGRKYEEYKKFAIKDDAQTVNPEFIVGLF